MSAIAREEVLRLNTYERPGKGIVIPTTSGEARIWCRSPRDAVYGWLKLLDFVEFVNSVCMTCDTGSCHAATILADCDDSVDGGVVYPAVRTCVAWE